MRIDTSSLPLLLTVPEAARLLRVCRRTVNRMLDNGQLRFVLICERRRIPRDAILRLAGIDPAADTGKAA